ncbi:MAG: RluA family pseudouridine synthase [Bacteroidales bacterium]|nr:RluA family pseudouridine synthase [Bacteroidales bacterium]
MIFKEEHIVPEGISDIRLSDYLSGIFVSLDSRKGCKKAIDKGLVTIDNTVAKTGNFVQSGMKICIYEQDLPPVYELKLRIAYNDEHIAVVLKPPGIPVSGNSFRTIQNAIPFNIKLSNLNDALPLPRPAHRLDALTGGLLLIAKTRSALTACNKMFEEKRIQKKYIALIIGETACEGIFNSEIEGKTAITKYRLLNSYSSNKFGKISRILLMPETGRTHQLRIHLAENETPIVGEHLYSQNINNLKGNGLFLFASELEFSHPFEPMYLRLSAEEPHKFQKILSYFTDFVKEKNVNPLQ